MLTLSIQSYSYAVWIACFTWVLLVHWYMSESDSDSAIQVGNFFGLTFYSSHRWGKRITNLILVQVVTIVNTYVCCKLCNNRLTCQKKCKCCCYSMFCMGVLGCGRECQNPTRILLYSLLKNLDMPNNTCFLTRFLWRDGRYMFPFRIAFHLSLVNTFWSFSSWSALLTRREHSKKG